MKMTRSLVASALLVGWAVWPSVAGQTAADATSDLANRYAESDTGFDNRTAPLDYLDLDGLVSDWLWTGRPGGCDADLSFAVHHDDAHNKQANELADAYTFTMPLGGHLVA